MAGQYDRRLEQRLAAHGGVGLDTSVLIYHFDANPRYLPLTTQILSAVLYGQCSGVISVAALLELNVRPYQLGRPDVAHRYEALLMHFPNVHIVDVNREIARRAAALRGELRIGAFDALQIATTLDFGATAFITNDRGLQRLSDKLDILLLDDFVE